ncbi:PilN domain-containing protein [Lysobacter sp. A421]
MSQIASSTSSRLGDIGTRLVPRVAGLWRWWGRSLAEWLPPRLRRALGFDRGRLLLHVDGDDLQLRLQQGDELRDLTRVGLADVSGPSDQLDRLLGGGQDDLPRWLLLAPATSLRRRLVLPAAAIDRLRDVVAFEIDRQTPFRADAVAFDARVAGRRESDGQLDVELVVVPRQALDPALDRLGSLASTLAGVDVAAGDGVPLGVNLLPVSERRLHRDPWAIWNAVLAAVAVVAVAALLWQLLDNRRAAADALEQAMAEQADAGRQAAAQRHQLASLVEGQAFLDQARARRPTAIEVMDELTVRLPDHTYLEKLAINDDQLLLIGLSGQAAALIGQLQGAQAWSSPALAGALQPDPGSSRDRFTLTAKLAVAAPQAPTPTSPTPPKPGEVADGAAKPGR